MLTISFVSSDLWRIKAWSWLSNLSHSPSLSLPLSLYGANLAPHHQTDHNCVAGSWSQGRYRIIIITRAAKPELTTHSTCCYEPNWSWRLRGLLSLSLGSLSLNFSCVLGSGFMLASPYHVMLSGSWEYQRPKCRLCLFRLNFLFLSLQRCTCGLVRFKVKSGFDTAEMDRSVSTAPKKKNLVLSP